MRSIVITGVSSGIGYGAAKEFARNGYRVFGSVRREEDAERLGAELGAGFVPLLFDVTDREAVVGAAERGGGVLGGSGLAGLRNKAGPAVGGPLLPPPPARVWREVGVHAAG